MLSAFIYLAAYLGCMAVTATHMQYSHFLGLGIMLIPMYLYIPKRRFFWMSGVTVGFASGMPLPFYIAVPLLLTPLLFYFAFMSFKAYFERKDGLK